MHNTAISVNLTFPKKNKVRKAGKERVRSLHIVRHWFHSAFVFSFPKKREFDHKCLVNKEIMKFSDVEPQLMFNQSSRFI